MSTNPKPAYRRVLLKLSGEALQGSEGFGIDPAVLERMAQEIKELVELGVQVGLSSVAATCSVVPALPRQA